MSVLQNRLERSMFHMVKTSFLRWGIVLSIKIVPGCWSLHPWKLSGQGVVHTWLCVMILTSGESCERAFYRPSRERCFGRCSNTNPLSSRDSQLTSRKGLTKPRAISSFKQSDGGATNAPPSKNGVVRDPKAPPPHLQQAHLQAPQGRPAVFWVWHFWPLGDRSEVPGGPADSSRKNLLSARSLPENNSLVHFVFISFLDRQNEQGKRFRNWTKPDIINIFWKD